MPLEQLRHLDHGLEPAAAHPPKPILEEVPRPTLVLIRPELAEEFLRRPGPRHFQMQILQRRKLRRLVRAEMLRVVQPQLPRSFEGLIAFGHQLLVFLAAHLVHRLPEVFADMKFVMQDGGVWNLRLNRPDKGLPHVHRHCFDRLLLLRAQTLPQLSRRFGRPLLHHLKHPRRVQIRQQGDVGLPTLEALLIHAQMPELVQLPPRQPALHGPPHDLMRRLPAESQQLARLAHAGTGQEHFHGKPLEEQGEAAQRSGPRHVHGLDPVLRTR